MMEHRTIREKPVAEGVSTVFGARLVDEDGVPVPVAVLTTLTLRLTDRITGAVINGHAETNILNANGGLVTHGRVVRQMTPGDAVLIESESTREPRLALFRWTWNGGADVGVHEYWYEVERLSAP